MSGVLIASIPMPSVPIALMPTAFVVGQRQYRPALTGSGLMSSSPDEALPADSGVVDATVAGRFDDFYRAHRDDMARALGLALRDAALGAEAADEAFARACQRWGTVGAYANPQGWVYRVGLNWARSWLRRVRRERERRPLLAQDHAVEDRPRDLDLEHALASLNDAHRAVIGGALLPRLVRGRDRYGTRRRVGHGQEQAQPRSGAVAGSTGGFDGRGRWSSMTAEDRLRSHLQQTAASLRQGRARWAQCTHAQRRCNGDVMPYAAEPVCSHSSQ